MKGKGLVLCGVLVALLALAACATASGQAAVDVSCDDFAAEQTISREVSVRSGDSFKVTLCSNASTGYSWEEAEIADASVLAETDRESVAPTGDAVGAPGSEVWTFKGQTKGKTTVTFLYSRPWEGGEKGTWELDLTVTVQ